MNWTLLIAGGLALLGVLSSPQAASVWSWLGSFTKGGATDRNAAIAGYEAVDAYLTPEAIASDPTPIRSAEVEAALATIWRELGRKK